MRGYDLRIDVKRAEESIGSFIKGSVEKAGAKGVVVGLSGGLDSSTVATLCAKFLGGANVLGLIMPERGVTPTEDAEDAEALADSLGMRYKRIEINDIFESFVSSLDMRGSNAAYGNLKARIRMCLLYYAANNLNMLVAGTGDRSELLIGYFTKYGDGGADILPIGGLYKTQVKVLAAHLGVPRHIVDKPSSPGLWRGHLAEEEIGFSYEIIDQVLHGIIDLKLSYTKVAEDVGVSLDVVRSIAKMVRRSWHKRKTPPIAPV